MNNDTKKLKHFLKRYAIKRLPCLLMMVGLLLGLIDFLLDKYIPDNMEFLIWIGNTLILAYIGYKIGKFIKHMYVRVYRDPLTGLPNKGYFYYRLNSENEKLNSRKACLSLAMIDMDGFKSINDTYGHLEGDKVIKNVADVLKQNVRNGDAAIRWGGDEFVLVLPNTNEIQANKIAETIRKTIEVQEYFCDYVSYKVTVSIGIYTIHKKINMDEFLSDADKALNKAKIRKNSVVVLNL